MNEWSSRWFFKIKSKHPENPSILQHCSAFCIPAEKGSAYKVGPARRPPTVSPNDTHTNKTQHHTTREQVGVVFGREKREAAATEKNTGQERCGENMQEKYETRTEGAKISCANGKRREVWGKNQFLLRQNGNFLPTTIRDYSRFQLFLCVCFFFVLRWGELLRLILFFIVLL